LVEGNGNAQPFFTPELSQMKEVDV
jgi:hypothetical protein